MKKTRLISLLLTAALAASCLPMAVAADNENLLVGATYTGAQAETGETDDEGNPVITKTTVNEANFKNVDGSAVVAGNEFLTIANRGFGTGHGFDINFEITEEDIAANSDADGKLNLVLYCIWDMRQSVPSNTDTSYCEGIVRAATGRVRFDASSSMNQNVFGSSLGGGNWENPGKQPITYTLTDITAGKHFIRFLKSGNDYAVHDIDIDNVKVWYNNAEDGTPVYLVNVSEDFLTATDESGLYTAVTTGAPTYFEDVEEPFYIANSDYYGNTEVVIDLAKPIVPGVYTLAGEFRFGEFTADGYTDANDKKHFTEGINDADIMVVAGDVVSKAVNINTVWADQEIVFSVAEATDKISILVDGAEDTVADPQKINFRNLTLTQDASLSRLIAGDEDNLLNGTVVTYNGTWDEVDGGYVYIPKRVSGNSTNYFIVDIDEEPVVGRTYYVGFDVWNGKGNVFRVGVNQELKILESYADGVMLDDNGLVVTSGGTAQEVKVYDGNGNLISFPGQKNGMFPIPHGNAAGTEPGANTVKYDWEQYKTTGMYMQRYSPAAETWEHAEMYFTPTKHTGGSRKMVFSFTRGSSSGAHIQEMKIDNFELFYYENGVKKVVYSNDFSSEADLITMKGDEVYAKVYTPYAENANESLRFDLTVEPSLVSVTPLTEAVTAFYDVADVANKAGEYTFSATVASEAVGGTAYIAVDGKAVTDAVVVTDDGIKLTYTANKAIESIEIVTDIKDVVTISNEMLTYYFEAPKGDATNDGKVNPLDVVYIQRYAAGWNGYAALVNADAADVSGNDEVNIYDAVLLARHIAKWVGYETVADLFGTEDGFDY